MSNINLQFREMLRETERATYFLLKQMQAYVPDADVIGLEYDEVTGTWMVVLGEARSAADGDPLRVIASAAGISLLDAYETVVAMTTQQVDGV